MPQWIIGSSVEIFNNNNDNNKKWLRDFISKRWSIILSFTQTIWSGDIWLVNIKDLKRLNKLVYSC